MIEVSEQTMNRIHALLTEIQNADKKVLKPAFARALMAGKTEAKRQAVQVYHIKPGDFNQKSYIKYNGVKHTASELIGTVSFAGSPIPLFKYKVTPTKPIAGSTAAAAVLKSNNPIPFDRKNDVHVLKMKNTGYTGIFKGENGKLKELYAPSTPKMIENEEVMSKIEDRVNEVLNQRMEHEIERLLASGG